MTRCVPAGVVNTAFAAMFSRLGESAFAQYTAHHAGMGAGLPWCQPVCRCAHQDCSAAARPGCSI